MQSLWTNHRRTKLNLNSVISPNDGASMTPASEDASRIEAASQIQELESTQASGPASLTNAGAPDSVSSPSGAATKRKTRLARAEDSKRSKTISGSSLNAYQVPGSSGGSIAKDYTPPSTRLSDLGGVDACVEKMLELVAMPLCHPEVYLHTGVQPPRGVLLHGPPGCGKTLLANAIAGVGFCPFRTLIQMLKC